MEIRTFVGRGNTADQAAQDAAKQVNAWYTAIEGQKPDYRFTMACYCEPGTARYVHVLMAEEYHPAPYTGWLGDIGSNIGAVANALNMLRPGATSGLDDLIDYYKQPGRIANLDFSTLPDGAAAPYPKPFGWDAWSPGLRSQWLAEWAQSEKDLAASLATTARLEAKAAALRERAQAANPIEPIDGWAYLQSKVNNPAEALAAAIEEHAKEHEASMAQADAAITLADQLLGNLPDDRPIRIRDQGAGAVDPLRPGKLPPVDEAQKVGSVLRQISHDWRQIKAAFLAGLAGQPAPVNEVPAPDSLGPVPDDHKTGEPWYSGGSGQVTDMNLGDFVGAKTAGMDNRWLLDEMKGIKADAERAASRQGLANQAAALGLNQSRFDWAVSSVIVANEDKNITAEKVSWDEAAQIVINGLKSGAWGPGPAFPHLPGNPAPREDDAPLRGPTSLYDLPAGVTVTPHESPPAIGISHSERAHRIANVFYTPSHGSYLPLYDLIRNALDTAVADARAADDADGRPPFDFRVLDSDRAKVWNFITAVNEASARYGDIRIEWRVWPASETLPRSMPDWFPFDTHVGGEIRGAVGSLIDAINLQSSDESGPLRLAWTLWNEAADRMVDAGGNLGRLGAGWDHDAAARWIDEHFPIAADGTPLPAGDSSDPETPFDSGQAAKADEVIEPADPDYCDGPDGNDDDGSWPVAEDPGFVPPQPTGDDNPYEGYSFDNLYPPRPM